MERLSRCSNQCSLKGAHCVLNQTCLTQLCWFAILLITKIHLCVTKLKICICFTAHVWIFLFWNNLQITKWCPLSAMGPNTTKVSIVQKDRASRENFPNTTSISFPSFLVITLYTELCVETLFYRGIFCRFHLTIYVNCNKVNVV